MADIHERKRLRKDKQEHIEVDVRLAVVDILKKSKFQDENTKNDVLDVLMHDLFWKRLVDHISVKKLTAVTGLDEEVATAVVTEAQKGGYCEQPSDEKIAEDLDDEIKRKAVIATIEEIFANDAKAKYLLDFLKIRISKNWNECKSDQTEMIGFMKVKKVTEDQISKVQKLFDRDEAEIKRQAVVEALQKEPKRETSKELEALINSKFGFSMLREFFLKSSNPSLEGLPITSRVLSATLCPDDVVKLRKAFECEYLGDVTPLSNYINDCFREYRTSGLTFYSPYFALIQSSGTGKSRSVARMAEDRYCVYLCYRKKGSVGFPCRSPNCIIEESLKEKFEWKSFFIATLAVVDAVINDCAADIRRDPLSVSLDKLLELSTSRIKNLDLENGRIPIGPKKADDDAENDVDKKKAACLSPKEFFKVLVINRTDGDHDFATIFWQAVLTCMKIAVMDYERFLYWVTGPVHIKLEHSRGDTCPLVFVFDEGTGLLAFQNEVTVKETEATLFLKKYSRQDKDSPFFNMRRAIQEKLLGIFVVLVDSSARVAKFQPVAIHYSSTRVAERGVELFQPFIHPIPTDRFFNKLPKTLSEVCDKTNLLRLGRPLWVKNTSYPSTENWEAIVDLAMIKLGVPVEVEKLTLVGAMALIGPRVHCSACIWSKTESEGVEELINEHMCYLVDVNKNRESFAGFYLSEPVLVAASHRKMSNMDYLCQAVDLIATNKLRGGFDAGEFGEFVARLVLILAWDDIKRSADSSDLFSPECVSAFLERLIGKEKIDQLRDSAARQPEKSFGWLTKLLNSRILFTHFAPCDQSLVVDPSQLLDLARRAAGGLFIKANQTGIDLTIPIVLGDDNTALNLSDSLSCFNIKVKNWAMAPSPADEQAYLKKLKGVAKKAQISDSRPTISLFFFVNEKNDRSEGVTVEAGENSLDIIVRALDQVAFLKNNIYRDVLNAMSPLVNRKLDVAEKREFSSISWPRVSGFRANTD